uniref:glucose 1,6-bisphosphate synthase n=1 Tax=Panthera onca TaxID=9690 RepID=UPI0029554FFD|nr:glucose 1,6-bisphosphate synthase [Panthera onca]
MAENAEGDLNSNLLHAPYHTGDPQLDTAIGQWLRWDKVGTCSALHPPVLPHARPPAHAQSALSRPHPVVSRLLRRWFRPRGGRQRSRALPPTYAWAASPGPSEPGYLWSLPFAVRGIAASLSHPQPRPSSACRLFKKKLLLSIIYYYFIIIMSWLFQELSLRLAERENARVVLATDPDADRLAVAELQENGHWKVFTGNELAALFGWWMFDCWKKNKSRNADVKNVYMLATTVSSKILKAIALEEGFHFEETLPGFKWIGCRIKDLLENGKEVLFAFEESIGFLCGTSVLDKDGVSAAVVVAEMAAYLETMNITLKQQLIKVYEKYGYHISKTSYFLCYDPITIKSIFERLRNFDSPKEYPKFCGTFAILHIRDVTTGYDSSQPNKKSVLPVSKNSQMITFTFQNGCVATLRTSGTEPKIKYYAEMCASPEQSDTALLEEELKKLIEALIENFLEPSKNGLIWRSA